VDNGAGAGPSTWTQPGNEEGLDKTEDTDRPFAVGVEADPAPEPTAPSPASEEETIPEDVLTAVDEVLDQVEQALSRLDQGTYGRCATCETVIDDVALEQDPARPTCVDCQPVGS
jgi:RNA polymerase-binding transcription factor DksA